MPLYNNLRAALFSIKNTVMAIVKVIEVIASSEKGFEDAVRNAVAEVSETVQNVDSVYVKDLKVHVKNGKISTYGAICKVAFRVEPKAKKSK